LLDRAATVAPTPVINIAGGPGGLTACARSSDAAQVNIEQQGKVLDLPWLWCCGYHLRRAPTSVWLVDVVDAVPTYARTRRILRSICTLSIPKMEVKRDEDI
jgi:hypothetical protein